MSTSGLTIPARTEFEARIEELIGRLERATPSDFRQLEFDIDRAIYGRAPSKMFTPHHVTSLECALALLPSSFDWLFGKGRTRPDEPLYGVQIFPADSGRMNEAPVPVAEAESNSLPIAVVLAALRARAALAKAGME